MIFDDGPSTVDPGRFHVPFPEWRWRTLPRRCRCNGPSARRCGLYRRRRTVAVGSGVAEYEAHVSFTLRVCSCRSRSCAEIPFCTDTVGFRARQYSLRDSHNWFCILPDGSSWAGPVHRVQCLKRVFADELLMGDPELRSYIQRTQPGSRHSTCRVCQACRCETSVDHCHRRTLDCLRRHIPAVCSSEFDDNRT